MPYCTPWTDREKTFLRENYPNKGKAWCATQLGRTPRGVAGQVEKLGLKLDQSGEHFKDYQMRAAQTKLGKKDRGSATGSHQRHSDRAGRPG